MDGWEPTKHGGFRRTTGGSSDGERRADYPEVGASKASPRTKFRWAWAEPLGLPWCPYVIRWRAETPIGSLRVHHWLASDDRRAFHDHPWWFLTFVVRGGYSDVNPRGCDLLTAPALRFRPALHRHTVLPYPGGAWTVMVTGRPLREWGFWKAGKFRKASKWFFEYGHHPCS